jgi:regulator of RNase E activity RraA
MKEWNNDDELFSLLKRELFPALVGDVMDQAGFTSQFLPPQLQPLHSKMKVAGRAMPVLTADVEFVLNEELLDKPFGLMLEALDDLKRNEVYVCTGASSSYALWGGLMSTRAKKVGGAGAVVNGYSRDTNDILDLDFPTFSYGGYAQDQGPRGKVVDFRIPIKLGNVMINPGDIIFGDLDGVCVIPQHIEEEIFAKSIEKFKKENLVKIHIEQGMTTCEAFSRYGVM